MILDHVSVVTYLSLYNHASQWPGMSMHRPRWKLRTKRIHGPQMQAKFGLVIPLPYLEMHEPKRVSYRAQLRSSACRLVNDLLGMRGDRRPVVAVECTGE